MPDTRLSIDGERFSINGAPTYSEIGGSRPDAHGLLMNARFIQGVFDDTADRDRYARWGRGAFDPEAHTDELIAALPDWHAHGLRAFTVGFQGGGRASRSTVRPCASTPSARTARRSTPRTVDAWTG
ncbi:hypothetical protein CMK11_16445 [Candidatus Poribacteria bacterium]|nr:hypothetical protein [Candidatus Poribacteria bacterium]